jgi:hypothetical protein
VEFADEYTTVIAPANRPGNFTRFALDRSRCFPRRPFNRAKLLGPFSQRLTRGRDEALIASTKVRKHPRWSGVKVAAAKLVRYQKASWRAAWEASA